MRRNSVITLATSFLRYTRETAPSACIITFLPWRQVAALHCKATLRKDNVLVGRLIAIRVASAHEIPDNFPTPAAMHRLSRFKITVICNKAHTRLHESSGSYPVILWRIAVPRRPGAPGSAPAGHSRTAQSVDHYHDPRNDPGRSRARFEVDLASSLRVSSRLSQRWAHNSCLGLASTIFRNLHYPSGRLINSSIELMVHVIISVRTNAPIRRDIAQRNHEEIGKISA